MERRPDRPVAWRHARHSHSHNTTTTPPPPSSSRALLTSAPITLKLGSNIKH